MQLYRLLLLTAAAISDYPMCTEGWGVAKLYPHRHRMTALTAGFRDVNTPMAIQINLADKGWGGGEVINVTFNYALTFTFLPMT